MKLLIIVLLFTSISNAQPTPALLTATIGTKHPALLLAMAKVESNYDMAKVGALGERGMLQLRPELHGFYALSTDHFQAADRYLLQLRKQCSKLGQAWFICYNYGPTAGRRVDNPTKTKYYIKVMEALREVHSRWPLL